MFPSVHVGVTLFYATLRVADSLLLSDRKDAAEVSQREPTGEMLPPLAGQRDAADRLGFGL